MAEGVGLLAPFLLRCPASQKSPGQNILFARPARCAVPLGLALRAPLRGSKISSKLGFPCLAKNSRVCHPDKPVRCNAAHPGDFVEPVQFNFFVRSNCCSIPAPQFQTSIASCKLAEGVGFEPTKSLRPCRFSRPVPSTTRSPLRLIQSGRHYITVSPLI